METSMLRSTLSMLALIGTFLFSIAATGMEASEFKCANLQQLQDRAAEFDGAPQDEEQLKSALAQIEQHCAEGNEEAAQQVLTSNKDAKTRAWFEGQSFDGN